MTERKTPFYYDPDDQGRMDALLSALHGRGAAADSESLSVDSDGEWTESKASTLENASQVVVLVSKSSMAHGWPATLAKELKPVQVLVPIVFDDINASDVVAGRRWIDFRDSERHSDSNQELAELLKRNKKLVLVMDQLESPSIEDRFDQLSIDEQHFLAWSCLPSYVTKSMIEKALPSEIEISSSQLDGLLKDFFEKRGDDRLQVMGPIRHRAGSLLAKPVLEKSHQQLADFFTDDSPQPLERLRHEIGRNPSHGAKAAEAMFDEAADEYWLNRCMQIVQILRRHRETRETANRLETRYEGMLLFSSQHYGSLRYLSRKKPESALKQLFTGDDEQWLQLTAQGGMGKSMMIRWLLVRHCLPTGIPCAVFDFDDVPIGESQNVWEILLHLLNQLNRQLVGNPLDDLLRSRLATEKEHAGSRKLQEESRDRKETQRIIYRAARSLRQQEFLVVIDTTEEAIHRHKTNFALLVDSLDQLYRESQQKLRVVLAGRLDLDTVLDLRIPAYEVPVFGREEATEYLDSQGSYDDQTVEVIHRKTGGIPFKLALFADLMRESPMSRTEIEQIRVIEYVYLMKRIIGRIQHPAVRLLVRYAAVAKQLDQDFAFSVIGKLVQEYCDGEIPITIDNTEHDQQALPSQLRKSDLYRIDQPRNREQLWEDLNKHVSRSNWAKSAGPGAITFHESVLSPMRNLVFAQPIYGMIHERAAEYFRSRAESSQDKSEILMCHRLEIFHEVYGKGTLERWRQLVDYWLERNDISSAVEVAAEPLDPEYWDKEKCQPVTLVAPEVWDAESSKEGASPEVSRLVLEPELVARAAECVARLNLLANFFNPDVAHEAIAILGQVADNYREKIGNHAPELLAASMELLRGQSPLDALDQIAAPASHHEELEIAVLRAAARFMGSPSLAEDLLDAASQRLQGSLGKGSRLQQLEVESWLEQMHGLRFGAAVKQQRFSDAIHIEREDLSQPKSREALSQRIQVMTQMLLTCGRPHLAIEMIEAIGPTDDTNIVLMLTAAELDATLIGRANGRAESLDPRLPGVQLLRARCAAARLDVDTARRLLHDDRHDDELSQRLGTLEAMRFELIDTGDLYTAKSALLRSEEILQNSPDEIYPQLLYAVRIWLALDVDWQLDRCKHALTESLSSWAQNVTSRVQVLALQSILESHSGPLEQALDELSAVQMETARALALDQLCMMFDLSEINSGQLEARLLALFPTARGEPEDESIASGDRLLLKARLAIIFDSFGLKLWRDRMIAEACELAEELTNFTPLRRLLSPDIGRCQDRPRGPLLPASVLARFLWQSHSLKDTSPLLVAEAQLAQARCLLADGGDALEVIRISGEILESRAVSETMARWRSQAAEILAQAYSANGQGASAEAEDALALAADGWERLGRLARAAAIRQPLPEARLLWRCKPPTRVFRVRLGTNGAETAAAQIQVTGEQTILRGPNRASDVVGEVIQSEGWIPKIWTGDLETATKAMESLCGIEAGELDDTAGQDIRIESSDIRFHRHPVEAIPSLRNRQFDARGIAYRAQSWHATQQARLSLLQEAIRLRHAPDLNVTGTWTRVTREALREMQGHSDYVEQEWIESLTRDILDLTPYVQPGFQHIVRFSDEIRHEASPLNELGELTAVRLDRKNGLKDAVDQIPGQKAADVLHFIFPFELQTRSDDGEVMMRVGSTPVSAFEMIEFIEQWGPEGARPLLILQPPWHKSPEENLWQLHLRNEFAARVFCNSERQTILAVGPLDTEGAQPADVELPATPWRQWRDLAGLRFLGEMRHDTSGLNAICSHGRALFCHDPSLPIVVPNRIPLRPAHRDLAQYLQMHVTRAYREAVIPTEMLRMIWLANDVDFDPEAEPGRLLEALVMAEQRLHHAVENPAGMRFLSIGRVLLSGVARTLCHDDSPFLQRVCDLLARLLAVDLVWPTNTEVDRMMKDLFAEARDPEWGGQAKTLGEVASLLRDANHPS